MNAVHNEQTKLLATALNNVAVAFIVVGFVTPVIALSFGFPNAPALQPAAALFVVLWLSTGVGLHWAARRALRSLKP